LINRLLNNLHPAINQDPQSSPALFVNGAGTIIIKDDVMQIIGAVSTQFSLRGYTFGSLTSAISGLGYSATASVPLNISAATLLDGTYSLPCTIPMFTSFLWQILKPVAIALVDALGAEGRALQEMILNSSEGRWLDSFGEIFGVTRASGEPDILYASRIFNLSVGVRVNNLAIQKTLRELQYASTVVDSGATHFDVNITIPTDAPEGFIYSTEQMRDILDMIRPAGVSYTILSNGSASDTASVVDSYTTITATTAIKYGTRKWGQMTWA
jgi:hypothetical protein